MGSIHGRMNDNKVHSFYCEQSTCIRFKSNDLIRKKIFSNNHTKFIGKQELDFTCPICMKDLQEGQLYYMFLCCKHFFHADMEDCDPSGTIVDWILIQQTCPVCRKMLKVKIYRNM